MIVASKYECTIKGALKIRFATPCVDHRWDGHACWGSPLIRGADMISRMFIVIGVCVVLAACGSGDTEQAPSVPSSGVISSDATTPATAMAEDAEQVVARLTSAGMCYPPSDSMAQGMDPTTVCMESPDDQVAGPALLVVPSPWSAADMATTSTCTSMSDLDKFGIIAGDTWFVQPTMNQPRSAMENYAAITTYKQACG